jgi:hypothetical protein
MRAEGETELAGDLQGVCISGGATATALFTVFTSAPATSKPNANNVAGGPVLTEATLFICSSAATTTTGTPTTSYCTNGTGAAPFSTVYGTISGNQISFSGVGLPGTPTFTFRLSNVRMNASAVTLSSTLTAATEQVLVSANNTSSAFATAATVGYVFPSLQVTTLRPTPTSNVAPTVKSFVTCTGNPVSLINPPVPSFVAEVKGLFAGAFKLLNGGGATVQDPDGSASESGTYQPADGSKAGQATQSTQIQLAFANVPSAVTLYLPTSVTAGTLTLAILNSAGGVVPASTVSGAPDAAGLGAAAYAAAFPGTPEPLASPESIGAAAGFTPTSGSVVVTYTVTATDKNIASEAVDIPVWYTFGGGIITSSQSAMTLLEGYAPQAAVSAIAAYPTFAVQTATPVPTTTVALCASNLLFPFVTSISGFDTGIALSNTSTDPFGTASSPGTCTLNFYGTGAPTPSTGVAAPGGTQTGGTSNAFLLSSVAPGFTGYMIAQCNYQFGHGFGYIIYNFGQTSGATMGYNALVMPNRATGVVSESLGQ